MQTNFHCFETLFTVVNNCLLFNAKICRIFILLLLHRCLCLPLSPSIVLFAYFWLLFVSTFKRELHILAFYLSSFSKISYERNCNLMKSLHNSSCRTHSTCNSRNGLDERLYATLHLTIFVRYFHLKNS